MRMRKAVIGALALLLAAGTVPSNGAVYAEEPDPRQQTMFKQNRENEQTEIKIKNDTEPSGNAEKDTDCCVRRGGKMKLWRASRRKMRQRRFQPQGKSAATAGRWTRRRIYAAERHLLIRDKLMNGNNTQNRYTYSRGRGNGDPQYGFFFKKDKWRGVFQSPESDAVFYCEKDISGRICRKSRFNRSVFE